mgnify:CR=1 FL=1
MLKLYVFETCPYCRKVRKAFDEMGLEYDIIRAERGTPENAELVKIGGKSQVPFLIDPERDVQMYESDDIIAYAREHYGTAAN